MASQITTTWIDYGGEKSTVGIAGPDINAGNYAAVTAQQDALTAAIDGMTLGVLNKTQSVNRIVQGSSANAASSSAQRENKWLVVYQDNQEWLNAPINTIPNAGFGKVFNYELPCANLVLLNTGSDIANPTEAQVGAFVSAFEAYARSPYGGTVTVLQIRHVGRAL